MINKLKLGEDLTVDINEERLIGTNGEWDLKNGVLIFENGNISEIKNIEDDN